MRLRRELRLLENVRKFRQCLFEWHALVVEVERCKRVQGTLPLPPGLELRAVQVCHRGPTCRAEYVVHSCSPRAMGPEQWQLGCTKRAAERSKMIDQHGEPRRGARPRNQSVE